MRELPRIQSIFRDVFDDESMRLTPEMGMGDIPEWDSIAHVKLVLAVEAEFGFRMTTAEVGSIRSVGDFLSAVESRAGR